MSFKMSYPTTYRWLTELRNKLGNKAADKLIQEAKDGVTGLFFSAENGRTFGTPDTRSVHQCHWDEQGRYIRTEPRWMVEAAEFALTLGIEIEIKDMQDFEEASARAKQLREIYKSVRYA